MHSPHQQAPDPGSGEARNPLDFVAISTGASILLLLAGAIVLGWMAASREAWGADIAIPAESRMWGHIIESSTLGVMLALTGLGMGQAAFLCWRGRKRHREVLSAMHGSHATVMEELELARETRAAESAVRTGQHEAMIERLDVIDKRQSDVRELMWHFLQRLDGMACELKEVGECVMTPRPNRQRPRRRRGQLNAVKSAPSEMDEIIANNPNVVDIEDARILRRIDQQIKRPEPDEK